MPLKNPITVLVSPLDWGLGHATRCIPIIHELIQQGDQVIIAASGAQKQLLAGEFPNLEIFEIPGYSIQYAPSRLLKWGLFLKIPAILRKIKRESRWLENFVKKYPVQVIISDNRYGLWHKDIFCIFVTHQLHIQSGNRKIFGWAERMFMKWNYHFISKFNECWIPDYAGPLSLSGELSHPVRMPPVPVRYIGILSRLKPVLKPVKKNTVLILLSGPEPHRTVFEKILLEQLPGIPLQTLVLRGLPGESQRVSIGDENVQILNHLPAGELNEKISESECIITRSGYSTLMDLFALNKPAIIVPTPGQSEQEYLGRYMHERKWMLCVDQKNFNLRESISGFTEARLKLPEIPSTNLSDLLASVRNG